MKRLILIISFCLLLAAPVLAVDYYFATNGSGTACTFAAPCSLTTILADTTKCNDNTFWGRGGTYVGKFTSTLDNCTVRSYCAALDGGCVANPSEWVIIDGFTATTLNGAIDASQTSMTVTDGSKILNSGWSDEFVIDGEVIKFCSKTGNSLTGCSRAASGTIGGAASHSNGATVVQSGGQLTISGAGTTYRDFEVTNSFTVRSEPETSLNSRGNAINVYGDSNNLINLVVHDSLQGIFTSSLSSNTLIYGVVAFNGGGEDSVGGPLGHSYYLENTTGYSRLYESISVNPFNQGIQGFGQTGPYVGGDWQGNIFVGAGSPLGQNNPNLVYGPNEQQSPTGTVNECYFYRNGSSGYNAIFGYAAGLDTGTFTNNYLGGGDTAITISTVNTLSLSGNIVFGAAINTLAAEAGYSWNNNTYYNTGTSATKFGNTTDVANQTFATWKTQTGYDASSTIDSGNLPDTVIVRPNAYETGRANIIIYAASAPTSINVDLATTGLVNGQAYTIKNAFDWNGGDVATGTYNASSTTVSVPLNGEADDVSTPVGWGTTPATTCPQFCAMVVLPGAQTQASLKGKLGGAVRLKGVRF